MERKINVDVQFSNICLLHIITMKFPVFNFVRLLIRLITFGGFCVFLEFPPSLAHRGMHFRLTGDVNSCAVNDCLSVLAL